MIVLVAVAVDKSVAHMWKWHWSSCKVSFTLPCSECRSKVSECLKVSFF